MHLLQAQSCIQYNPKTSINCNMNFCEHTFHAMQFGGSLEQHLDTSPEFNLTIQLVNKTWPST